MLRHYGRHLPVTLAVGGINIFWLLPLALLVAEGKIDGMLALLIGYLPLAFLALRLRPESWNHALLECPGWLEARDDFPGTYNMKGMCKR